MPAQAVEPFITGQSRLRRQRVYLIGAERAPEIVRGNLLVRPRAHPGIGGVAVAAVLKLLEQVAKPAADHAARGTACEQAAKPALEQVTKSTAARQTGIHSVGQWGRRRRAASRLTATKMLDRLV